MVFTIPNIMDYLSIYHNGGYHMKLQIVYPSGNSCSYCFDSYDMLYWFIDRVGKSFASSYKHFSLVAWHTTHIYKQSTPSSNTGHFLYILTRFQYQGSQIWLVRWKITALPIDTGINYHALREAFTKTYNTIQSYTQDTKPYRQTIKEDHVIAISLSTIGGQS